MKHILLIITLICISKFAYSQILISILLGDKLNDDKIEFGIDGGLNYSSISGLDNAKYKPGFNLGFYFDFKIKETRWKFNTGVIVKSPLGAKNLPAYSLNDASLDSTFLGGKVIRKLRYFTVPITLKYTFRNHFFAKGGVYGALRSKCKDEFENNINGNDVFLSKDITDNYNLIDLGLAVGIGYRLMNGNGMNIGIQYHQGITNIVKSKDTPDQFNNSIYFNIGIPVGKGKAENKNIMNK